MVIALFIDVVMNVGIRHRRAEKVVGVDRKAHLLADRGELFRTFDRDFEFRFLVFLDFKVTTGFRFAY